MTTASAPARHTYKVLLDSVIAAPMPDSPFPNFPEFVYAVTINETITTGLTRNEAWRMLLDAGHTNCYPALKAARDNYCAWVPVS